MPGPLARRAWPGSEAARAAKRAERTMGWWKESGVGAWGDEERRPRETQRCQVVVESHCEGISGGSETGVGGEGKGKESRDGRRGKRKRDTPGV